MVRDESKNNHTNAGFYRELVVILVGIKKAIKTFQFYAEKHPARAKALDHSHKQITELLAQRAPLSLQIDHEGFSCDDVPVGQDHLFLREFASQIALRGIQGIRLLPGVRLEDLQHLTELLTLEAVDVVQQGGGRTFLQRRGASTVEVDDLHVEFSEASSQPERPEPTMNAPEAMASSMDEPEGTREAKAQEEAPPDLEKLIAELQTTDRPARYETITEELSRLARVTWTRGEDRPSLRIMTTLGLELHPKNPKDETVKRYARWTLGSLLDYTGPQLVIDGFCRAGLVSQDDVVHLLLMLKEEMAEAVVQQLVIERDLTTRQKLEDLLVQMGDVSLPVVISALKAPSPETVRLLFPLLPKLQAPDTPEILKRLLRHYNPLIRAESVRLLGRIQLEMTDEPLLKALADSETSVRQAAMAVLSGIKLKAAVGPLRQIAEEPPGTRDIKEQKMAVAALGAIGEPEALLTLIALLRQKRWFHRRATEKLRIAAAYALGKLGGPQAEEALQTVAQSARPALKHACEVALKNPYVSDEPKGAP